MRRRASSRGGWRRRRGGWRVAATGGRRGGGAFGGGAGAGFGGDRGAAAGGGAGAEGGEGFVLTGADALVQWVNPAFTAMCGYTLEELRGRKLGPLLQGPETDAATVERMRRAVHEYRPCRETILNYEKNGRPYWVEIAITPICDDAGQPLWLAARGEREGRGSVRAGEARVQCGVGAARRPRRCSRRSRYAADDLLRRRSEGIGAPKGARSGWMSRGRRPIRDGLRPTGGDPRSGLVRASPGGCSGSGGSGFAEQVAQLDHAAPDARFHGGERLAQLFRDLGLGQPLEKRELQRFALLGR